MIKGIIVAIKLITFSAAFGNNQINDVFTDKDSAPWQRHALDYEIGLTWNIGDLTDIPYRIVPIQLSWRSPAIWVKHFDERGKLVIRNQFTVMGDWVENGPEDYYFGFSAAPSLEWWSRDDTWSIYFSAGGGAGWTNSQGVEGGQGQDFSYNWFMKGGLRYQIMQDYAVNVGAFFQHRSNLGATDPNPGIDVLGVTVGMTYSF